jgi:basic secretory peptidase family protein
MTGNLARALLWSFVVSAASCSSGTATADESPWERHLYPLAPAKTGDPPTFVLDTSDIADTAENVRWAEEAKTLCEQWYPIIHRFLATEEWKPPTEIKLIFKKELKVPAYASGSAITVSAEWAGKHPDDFGCVIHELTHVIQSYPNQRGKPGWLVEGIADYIRFWKYEPEVPRPRIDKEKASYKDSYRTTAAFLAWITWKYDKRIVRKLDKALREGKYSDAIFGDVTGRSLDALWEEFVAR